MGQHANPTLERKTSKKYESFSLPTDSNISNTEVIKNLLQTFFNQFKLRLIKFTTSDEINHIQINLILGRVVNQLRYYKKKFRPVSKKSSKFAPLIIPFKTRFNVSGVLPVVPSYPGNKNYLAFIQTRQNIIFTSLLNKIEKFIQKILLKPVFINIRYGNGDSLVKVLKSNPRFKTFLTKHQILEKQIQTGLVYKSATFLTEYTKSMLSTTKNHRSVLNAIKDALAKQNYKKLGLKGIKIVVWGKISGIDRSKNYKIVCGTVPTQTLSHQASSTTAFVNTPTGTFGIKTILIF